MGERLESTRAKINSVGPPEPLQMGLTPCGFCVVFSRSIGVGSLLCPVPELSVVAYSNQGARVCRSVLLPC